MLVIVCLRPIGMILISKSKQGFSFGFQFYQCSWNRVCCDSPPPPPRRRLLLPAFSSLDGILLLLSSSPLPPGLLEENARQFLLNGPTTTWTAPAALRPTLGGEIRLILLLLLLLLLLLTSAIVVLVSLQGFAAAPAAETDAKRSRGRTVVAKDDMMVFWTFIVVFWRVWIFLFAILSHGLVVSHVQRSRENPHFRHFFVDTRPSLSLSLSLCR